MTLPFIFREMVDGDEPFIFNSFLKSFKANSTAYYTDNQIYYKNQSELINYLLDNCHTLIACFPEDPEMIMGYIIYEHIIKTLVIHYIYVKNSLRLQKIASNMIQPLLDPDNTVVVATHCTNDFKKLKYKINGKRLSYDPYFIANQQRIHDRA